MDVMKTLFLNPPSYDDFDGGAGSRYQATREVWSFWYPTWLAYPAGMLPGARLLDAPPHGYNLAKTVEVARDFDFVVVHTSTPSFRLDVRTAEQRSEALMALHGVLLSASVAERATILDDLARWSGRALPPPPERRPTCRLI